MAGGELSPSLYPRTDTNRYAFGLRTMRNFFTRKDGGAQNRAGTEFITRTRDANGVARLIPFIVNDDEAYIYEFTDKQFRVFRNGAPRTIFYGNSYNNITNISQAAQGVVSVADASLFIDGAQVYIESVKGMGELNGNIYVVSDVTATTFKLTDLDGNYINTASNAAYISGGTVKKIVIGTHPYSDTELSDVQYVQSGSIMTLTHPDHPVKVLALQESYEGGFPTGTFTAVQGPQVMDNVIAYALSAPTAGAYTYRYAVTAILANGEETTPIVRLKDANWIPTAITQDNPCVITVASTTGLVAGDMIFINGIKGMFQINGKYFIVKSVTATEITINADSSFFSTFASSIGTITEAIGLASIVDTTSAVPTVSAPNVISNLIQPSGQFEGGQVTGFNIYLNTYGIFGFIGTSNLTIFNDTGLTIDVASSPPEILAFADYYTDDDDTDDDADDGNLMATWNNPSCVGYLQQRRVFANFGDNTELVVASQTGRVHSFTKSIPLIDSDSFSFQAIGKKISSVRHLLEMGRLLIFTQSGVFSAGNGNGGAISPTSLDIKHHAGFGGSSNLSPILLDNEALYVQSKGCVIRNITFDFNSDGFNGNDFTLFSTHLFEGHEIVDWTYQNYPNSIIWAVRDDGVMLGLTYVREQEVLAWHRHDTKDGFVENVCCIPENGEDVLYIVVRRIVNGLEYRYLERMASRFIDDVVDNIFLDSSVTYDGRNTDINHTMDLSGGTEYDNKELLTLNTNSSFFTSSDVGNYIHINEVDTDEISPTYNEVINQYRFKIVGYTSALSVTGRVHKTVPSHMRVPTSNWSRAVDTIKGLGHLEGKDVSVYADGYVVANPNNKQNSTILTVLNGQITLPNNKCYSVINVGLPITADIETLDIDISGEQTLADKNKLATGVMLYLDKSRGGFVGPKPPPLPNEDFLGGLIEFKPRNSEMDYGKPGLKTGVFELSILPEWNSHGRIFIRQTDPLPMSVLGVAVLGLLSGRG